MARDETGRFELGEHAVDRCEADCLRWRPAASVDVLGAHVARRAVRQDVEDFSRGSVTLRPALRRSLPFAGGIGFQALRHAVPSGMIRVQLSIINGCAPL